MLLKKSCLPGSKVSHIPTLAFARFGLWGATAAAAAAAAATTVPAAGVDRHAVHSRGIQQAVARLGAAGTAGGGSVGLSRLPSATKAEYAEKDEKVQEAAEGRQDTECIERKLSAAKHELDLSVDCLFRYS